MAVVVDDVDRAGVYARSSQGRRVQPAATNRHSHISTRRWCVGGLAVKQAAYDRSRDFPAQLYGSEEQPSPARRTRTVSKPDGRFDSRSRDDVKTAQSSGATASVSAGSSSSGTSIR